MLVLVVGATWIGLGIGAIAFLNILKYLTRRFHGAHALHEARAR